MPSIAVESYDSEGFTLKLTKADGSDFKEEDLDGEVLTISVVESYVVTSVDYPRYRLMETSVDVQLDVYEKFEIEGECDESLAFGISD
jgi:hypothetical protein